VAAAAYLFLPGAEGGCRPSAIYDESADGAQQIAAALARARAEHQRVLLQFGANWCVWCQKIHCFFKSDEAVKQELAGHYRVVLIDVNQGRNAATVEKYGHPTDQGLPVLVVLDADGRPLTTQATGEFVNPAEGQYDSQKVLAFLKQWSGAQYIQNPSKFPSALWLAGGRKPQEQEVDAGRGRTGL